jgi:hypothetical protein
MFQSPLMIRIGLIGLTIISTYYRFIGSSDPWVAIIFCIVFFGGLLILFIYISRLAQNEKIQLKNWKLILLAPIILSVELFLPSWETSSISLGVRKAVYLFTESNYLVTIVLMLYLLVALVAVVKITFFYKGALREIKY